MTDEAWIDTVRLARDMGDVSQLLPSGVASAKDLPYHLLHAIRSGLHYLGFEELDREDVPPRNIWSDTGALNQWFKVVRSNHESRYRNREIEDPVSNPAAAMLVT